MSAHNTGAGLPITRGTSNSNARGNNVARRRRREYLVATYRANVDVEAVDFGSLEPVKIPACRCYRCGQLLTVDTVTVDRINPGCKGGTYARGNIRPACGPCNSETGGGIRA